MKSSMRRWSLFSKRSLRADERSGECDQRRTIAHPVDEERLRSNSSWYWNIFWQAEWLHGLA
jgi:hypothetical protein